MSEFVIPYEEAESIVSTRGGFRVFLSILLASCFFYTIPVIKTPYGWTTYIRLDDIAGFVFVIFSIPAILRREDLSTARFAGLIMIALILALPSVVWGFILDRQIKNAQYGVWQTVHYVKIFLFFLSMMVLPINIKTFRKLAMLVWCGSVFVGIYGGLQYYGVLTLSAWAEKFAESGPWGGGMEYLKNTALGPLSNSHACIGAYMVIAIFVTLFLIRTAWGITKFVYIASMPFFMIVILWSGSRADFLGVFVGMLAYLLFSKVRPAGVIAVIAIGVAAYIIMTTVPAIRARFLETGSREDYSSGRLAAWAKQILYLITHPQFMITGIGLGNFSAMLERVGLNAAHNNYLHFLVECGIIGVILPAMFFKRIAVILKELYNFSKSHRELAVAFGSLIAALLGIAATQEIFVPGPALVSFPAYFAFLLGAVVAVYRTAVFDAYENQEYDESQ